jgi:hypothetical protein
MFSEESTHLFGKVSIIFLCLHCPNILKLLEKHV